MSVRACVSAGLLRHASSFSWASWDCPEAGCSSLPDTVIDVRVGVLRWSDANTWKDRTGGKPKAGENVTIPQVRCARPPPLPSRCAPSACPSPEARETLEAHCAWGHAYVCC